MSIAASATIDHRRVAELPSSLEDGSFGLEANERRPVTR